MPSKSANVIPPELLMLELTVKVLAVPSSWIVLVFLTIPAD